MELTQYYNCMNVKHKRHIFYFLTKKKIDKNLLSRRKRAIARITYAGDKAGFPKSGHIFYDILEPNILIYAMNEFKVTYRKILYSLRIR